MKYKTSIGWREIGTFVTPTTTAIWTAPDLFGGRQYKVGYLIVSGGSSGSACVDPSNKVLIYGGACGASEYGIQIVYPGQQYPVVVGKGGSSVTVTGSVESAPGENGGSSSIFGHTVSGSAMISQEKFSTYGGTVAISSSNMFPWSSNPLMSYNPFNKELFLGVGGSTKSISGGKNRSGVGGGDAKIGTGVVIASAATSVGCGGGAALSAGSGGTAISGAGYPGCVKIYVMGGK